jgi:hypothetical protein
LTKNTKVPYLIIFIVFLLQIACHTSAQDNLPEPKPLNKKVLKIQSPNSYSEREFKNGKKYDPQPRVILVNEKSGIYELRWIGYDGKEKVVEYQRYNAIDLIVRADVEEFNGKFVYRYTVNNLKSSPTFLSTFIIQNYADDIKYEEIHGIFIGQMASSIPYFKEGNWLNFGILSTYKPEVLPGKSIDFVIYSNAPSGIVMCRATGGAIGLKGAGEHMPTELEAVLPGYDELPYGYSVGPVEKLATMSKSEKAKYFLDNLPKFQEAGWLTPLTAKKYVSIFEREDLAEAFDQAKKDYSKEIITSEVFSIIVGLNQ